VVRRGGLVVAPSFVQRKGGFAAFGALALPSRRRHLPSASTNSPKHGFSNRQRRTSMTTQNSNVAPAESTETWGVEMENSLAGHEKPQGPNSTYKRTDGFIKNVESAHPFDVIRADVVLERLSVKANYGCGLHYEIYEYNLIASAMEYLERLPERDRSTFHKAATNIGIKLTEDELVKCANAYCDLRNELFEDY
jgi:hypothetical protein